MFYGRGAVRRRKKIFAAAYSPDLEKYLKQFSTPSRVGEKLMFAANDGDINHIKSNFPKVTLEKHG